jgi:hypothetical protein
MKKNVVFMLVVAALFVAASGMRPVRQDDPPVKKKNARMRIVTIKDGKEQVVDTIITGDKVQVFHSGKGKDFTWTTTGEVLSDSVLKNLEIIREEVDGKKVIIHRGTRGRGPVHITETETVGDSGRKVIVHVETSYDGKKDVSMNRPMRMHRHRMMRTPFSPGIGVPLGVMPMRRHLQGRNVIDLTDPGIISYEKKKLPGGKEKITIIRNEVKEENVKVMEIRTGDDGNEELIREIPHLNREIKVKKEMVKPETIEKK